MRFRELGQALVILVATGVSVGTSDAIPSEVLAQISVRNSARPGSFHGELFRFPDNVRDYSRASFEGWSFRQELGNGGVRVLEVARARTRGAYLEATDLFPDGHFSTMSHTVLMVFPRQPAGRVDLYALREDAAGNLRLLAPDGSTLLLDARSGAILPTADFSMAPQGAPGLPPHLRHSGLNLQIRAVGKSPFLRGTPVLVTDATGTTCALATEDVFSFSRGAESDVFRFESDRSFFDYLSARCGTLRLPEGGWQLAETGSDNFSVRTRVFPDRRPGEKLSDPVSEASSGDPSWPSVTGPLWYLLRLFSN